jgi:hypothetical protein
MSQWRFEPSNFRIKVETVTANQPARIVDVSSLSSVMSSQALYGGGSYFLLTAFGVEVSRVSKQAVNYQNIRSRIQ